MDHLKFYITSAIGLIGASISYAVDGLGLAFVTLIILMGVDFLSGLMIAVSTKKVNSTIGMRGFIRKLYVVLLIGAVYVIERAMIDQGMIGGAGYIADGVTFAYCAIEFISITENGGKLGVWMPNKVKDIIAMLKDKGEGR